MRQFVALRAAVAVVALCVACAYAQQGPTMELFGSSWPQGVKQLDGSHVADVIAHMTGTLPPHATADRSAFPDVDLFAAGKSNLLVVAPGLESLPSQDSHVVDVVGPSASCLHALLTGQSADKSADVEAHKTPSVLDLFEHSHGTARMLVVSADNVLAHAFATEDSHRLAVDLTAGRVGRVAMANSLQTLSTLSGDGLDVVVAGDVVTVRLAGSHTAVTLTASSSLPADYKLVLELLALVNVNKLATGEHRAFVSVAFSTIVECAAARSDSAHFVRVLSALIRSATRHAQASLGDGSHAQLLSLPAHQAQSESRVETLKETFAGLLRRHTRAVEDADVAANAMLVGCPRSPCTVTKQRFNLTVSPVRNWECPNVDCVPASELKPAEFKQAYSTTCLCTAAMCSNDTCSECYCEGRLFSQGEMYIYQTTLWTSVFFIAAIALALNLFCNSFQDEDTLLFRSAAPKPAGAF